MRHSIISVWLILMFNTDFINLAPISISKLWAERLLLSSRAINFMKKFGYLPPNENSESLYMEKVFVDAIKNLQKFGNIPETGKIDNETLKLMETPRCGVADIKHSLNRKKRYIVGSEGWRKREVTYYIANWSPKLKEEAVVDEMERAFDAWSDYSRLNFRQITNPNADIVISFDQGFHGDGYPFDGPGNILAHAFFPYEMDSYGGDIHFDDDEKWEIRPSDPYEATDFFSVAVHELGHSLGLSHSTIPTSIMFPYYKGYTSAFQLDYDDLLGLYELYISHQKGEQEYTTTDVVPKMTTESENEVTFSTKSESKMTSIFFSTTQKTNFQNITFIGDYETVEEHRLHENKKNNPISDKFTVPDICVGDIDTLSVFRNELFIFKGEYLWRLVQRGLLDNEYPIKFHQLFHGLPAYVTKIDAAYQRDIDSSIILFYGDKYWTYDGDKFSIDSPRSLSDYGIPINIDKIEAALIWPKTEKTYLLRRDLFWSINETLHTLDPNSSQDIRKFQGIPPNFDTAMTWTNGAVYFFRGKYFWKLDPEILEIEQGYPLLSPQYWFGCPDES